MTLGVWKPASEQSLSMTGLTGLLEQLPVDALQSLEGLTADAFEAQRNWIKLPAQNWAAAEALPLEHIRQLIRFFTLAEYHWAGWEAGKLSPVIPLVAQLKQRDAFDATFRRWIKTNTDNRYLPNGAIL
ncbi:MAG: hypothetical protein P8I59_12590 [Pseudomonadales bacterium]|jgi:hypothetical protein|nr:hypothetical protein [Gammaproteobacteria bacterium]MDG1926070.1 hypothetical protein [Pseudomonadales bacterium]